MTHLGKRRKFNSARIQVTLLAAVILAATACKKSMTLNEEGAGIDNQPVSAELGANVAGLLTRTSLGANGLIQQIGYNSKQQPVIILHYAGSLLTDKDSMVYDASGKLQKVLNYSPDFLTKGKFELSGNTKFEWDAKGQVSRKTSYDQESGSLEEDNRYVYDNTGRLISITSSTNSRWSKDKTITQFAYENKNIVRVTNIIGQDVVSRTQINGFDKHPTYITHPLLRYLLDAAENEMFSEQNASDVKNVVYVNLGSKKDSVVTVTKNTFQYNAASRPVKVAFTSTIYNPGNQKPATSKGTIDYNYSK